MIRPLVFLVVLSFFLTERAHALPSYQEVRKSYVKSDSLLLDRNGEVLHELRVDQGRRRLDWTPLQGISPVLQNAVVHAEDRRFYEHSGMDYKAMARALMQGLTQEGLRGASTITMQLASMLDGDLLPFKGRRSLWQKWKQILKAWEIDETWSKEEILETYLNLVTFRGELQGISATSRALFGKDPHGLNQSESLILASLIRSPNASFEQVLRRIRHLNSSVGWQIGDDEIQSKLKEVFLGSNFVRPRADLAPHVSRQLLKGKPPGSQVISTLDGKVQRFALGCLKNHLISLKSQNVQDGSVLIVENRTGEVLAYVSFTAAPSHRRFVDGVRGRRQAGSTLKPFLYALAFDKRILTPASVLEDAPLDIAVLGGIYQPKDYDSEFRGLVTCRVALASSLNVPAVRTLILVGLEPFLRNLRSLGIKGLNESGDFYGPALALGSADVTLWELANAYRTLANGGTWTDLQMTRGEECRSPPKRVFSEASAFLVSDILSDREARSLTFGLENPLATRFWTAVKTGTSKEMRDNWCIGYSQKYTVGVWVGNFTGEPMWNVSGITGAAPIWVEVMNWLHRNDVSPRREPSAKIVRKKIDFRGGPEPSREEWFIQGTEPHSEEKRIGQFNQRIVYPLSDTVIALDPDIPPEHQKIFFISQTHEEDLRWVLNGHTISRVGKVLPWTPKTGVHTLMLCDRESRVIDSIHFEVRGPSPFGPLPSGGGVGEAIPIE